MLGKISCSPCGYPLNWTPPSDSLAFSGFHILACHCLDFDIHSVIRSDSEDHRILETLDGKLNMSEWFQENHRCWLIIIFNQGPSDSPSTVEGRYKKRNRGGWGRFHRSGRDCCCKPFCQLSETKTGRSARPSGLRRQLRTAHLNVQNTFSCSCSGPSCRYSTSYFNSSSDGASCEEQSVS